jgi:uncharacterized sulfatase
MPRQVILIMVDTQRKDMINAYSSTGLKTPCLDRLASQGVRFERAYCCQPVCGPARAALFTGIYPHSNGAWGNSMPIGDNVKTVGQRLRDHGVHCGYIGKWHVDGGDYFGLGRCPDGWDPAYWYDMRNYLEELTPEERVASRSPARNRTAAVTEELTFGHRCSNRAIRFIEKFTGEDFFLTLSYDEPHGPFVCPEPFASMYDNYAFPKSSNVYDTLEGKPEHHRVWAGGDIRAVPGEDFQIRHADYFACNSFVDHQIGRVLDCIDRYALEALVIYTADHGDMMASHGIWNKGPVMYQEITNVPFIVRWPGCTPAGVASDALVSHIDVVPTIIEHFGIPRPALLEGRSALPLFRTPSTAVSEHVFVEFGRYEVDHDGFGGYQPVRCVVDSRYKLVVNLLTSDELYDLQSDPQEMVNRIDSPAHVAIRNRLHDRLLDWMNDTRDPFRGYYWERRPWRTDARPATWGYTGMTRQRENEEYEPRQLDYDTGLEMTEAVRQKKT